MMTIAFAGNRAHARLNEIKPMVRAFLIALEEVVSIDDTGGGIAMLTGLADGADMEAAEAFNGWQPQRDGSKRSVAVLPFAVENYELVIDDKARYRALLATCDEVIPMDNMYANARPDYDGEKVIKLRNQAFRQQALHMLHNCNLLLAAADTSAVVKPGGTLDTIEIAQQMGIPVVLIPLRNDRSTIKAELLPGNYQSQLYMALARVVDAMA